jgi:REP element-mobilizing transposase RayT
MSSKYKIWDNNKVYFMTLTVVGWIDVFTRKNHKFLLIDSLKYCQKEKGLVIFAYCLMPSHLHLIARAEGLFTLSEIMRDLKKFTSKALVNQIISENESRRNWMLSYFMNAAASGKGNYKLWQDGNHPVEITSNKFFQEKLEYIHSNPVEEMIVEKQEDYYFSSARNYASLSYPLEVVIETLKQRSI